MSSKVCILFIASLLSQYVDTSRILGVFPFPSISHQVVFRGLMHELANRGHEVVIVTPNPALPKERPPDNITEIDTSVAYQDLIKMFKEINGKRGAVITPEMFGASDTSEIFVSSLEHVFEHPEFKAILEDKTKGFDLVISEQIYSAPLALGKVYNAPVIWFSSFYGYSAEYELFGVPSSHPILYPELFRCRLYNLSFFERIYETYIQFYLRYQLRKIYPIEEVTAKKYFGDSIVGSIHELRQNVDLMFVNANPIFEGNRPVPPNVIHLGALHMKPRKEIPKDLKSYLDNSKRGVVYLSLGSNVQFSLMDAELVEVFIKAVEDLPYDVLWKQDLNDLPREPKNARIEKWFPQRDLLHHPNIKAFITQGGLQSADETIDAGVPVVILPFFGDQWYNAEQYARLGVGIKLDVLTLESEQLVEAVKTVIKDKSYRQNMEKLRRLVRDQPQTPLERAVWWTEYLIRHRGAKHLRSASANVTWAQYLMLDVVIALVSILVVGLAILFIIVRSALKLVLGGKIGEKFKLN